MSGSGQSADTGGCLGFLGAAVALPVLALLLLSLTWAYWPWIVGVLVLCALLAALDARRGRPDVWRAYLKLTPLLVGLGALVGYAAQTVF